jgi:hypothetical protein
MERATGKNAPLRDRPDAFQPGQSIGITYGVRQFEVEIEGVVDLRYPDTQRWFAKTFIALELQNKERVVEETRVRVIDMSDPVESFAQLLPVIVSLETGGGMIFGQAIGRWLRQRGANALIFPSARSNAFVKVRDGTPVEWGGWNMVVYAGAREAGPMELFGRMGQWRDPDHDHIHVDFTESGPESGSFSIRGVREFNLLDFDLKKQVACGVREDDPVLQMTGVRNEFLSRGANAVLDAERKARTLWYADVDYISFLHGLETKWRESA